jgi:ankyrin repeat protein
VDGQHTHNEAKRKELVKLLLDRGADVNLVAGNGCTALDIAKASKAPSIVKLLKEYGGKRAAEL